MLITNVCQHGEDHDAVPHSQRCWTGIIVRANRFILHDLCLDANFNIIVINNAYYLNVQCVKLKSVARALINI